MKPVLISIASLLIAAAALLAVGLYLRERLLIEIGRTSALVQTDVGLLEYQLHGEYGPGVLIVHGTPGGHDQLMTFSCLLSRKGFQVATVSRPGYGRTPLSSGRTFEEQSNLLRALLDHLGWPAVHLIGVSGGGLVVTRYAIGHEGTTRSLTLIASLTDDLPSLEMAPSLSVALEALAIVGASWPGLLMHTLQGEQTESAELIPAKLRRQLAADVFRSLGLHEKRRAGYQNDIHQIRQGQKLPLATITAPTLLIHGTADTRIPFAFATEIASRISRSELVPISAGPHAIFVSHAARVLDETTRFILKAERQSRSLLAPVESGSQESTYLPRN